MYDVLLMANAPTISPAQLSADIKALRDDPTADSAVTVSCYNMWSPLCAHKIDQSGLDEDMIHIGGTP